MPIEKQREVVVVNGYHVPGWLRDKEYLSWRQTYFVQAARVGQDDFTAIADTDTGNTRLPGAVLSVLIEIIKNYARNHLGAFTPHVTLRVYPGCDQKRDQQANNR